MVAAILRKFDRKLLQFLLALSWQPGRLCQPSASGGNVVLLQDGFGCRQQCTDSYKKGLRYFMDKNHRSWMVLCKIWVKNLQLSQMAAIGQGCENSVTNRTSTSKWCCMTLYYLRCKTLNHMTIPLQCHSETLSL